MNCVVSKCRSAVLAIGAAEYQIATQDFVEYDIVENISSNGYHFRGRFYIENQTPSNFNFQRLCLDIAPSTTMHPFVIRNREKTWINQDKPTYSGPHKDMNCRRAQATATDNGDSRVLEATRTHADELHEPSGAFVCNQRWPVHGESDFCRFAAKIFANCKPFRHRDLPTFQPGFPAENELAIAALRYAQTHVRSATPVVCKLVCKVAVHVVIKGTCEGAATLWVGVNHADAKLRLGHCELSAQDISRVKFDDAALAFQFAVLRLNRVNKGNMESPGRYPVAEAKEGSPLAVRISPEQQCLELFTVARRDSKQANSHDGESIVGAMNPAEDFIYVRVKPVLVFVPGRGAAAIMGMVAHKLPSSAVTGDHDTLGRTRDSP